MSAYAEGSIAGISLVKDGSACKVLIIDAPAFFSAYQGSTRIAADGTPYTQLHSTGTKGARFGVLMEYMPLTVFAALKLAIDSALAAQQTFNITLSDDLHSINVSALPDYSSGNWITYPTQRLNGNYVAGVTMRFICTA